MPLYDDGGPAMQGGHADAAEILHKDLTPLLEALGVSVDDAIPDGELWTHFVTQCSKDQLLTFMRTEFGRGYLAATALYELNNTMEAALHDGEETEEGD